jgi:hypothetical protein
MFPYLGLAGLGGSLICLYGNKMAICTLETATKVIPRRLKINATPSRIIYVSNLNKLVVAGTVTDVKVRKDAKDLIISKKRWVRPTFRVVDPDRTLIKESDLIDGEDDLPRIMKSAHSHVPMGKAGERILALLSWNPSIEGKTYQWMAAGTHIHRVDGPPRGRLLTFALKASSNAEIEVVFRSLTQLRYDHPVYSIVAWGSDALVYCAGKTLMMQKVDLVEGRWHKIASFELTSPAVALSVHEPLISVNTAMDSIFIFKFENNEFHPCGADAIARDGQHLITLSQSIVLSSNKGCSVVGFKPPLESYNKNTAPTLFEALLHTSVTRLREALIRPPWMLDRRAILGSTADGTMYQFTLLTRSEQQLLRFVQNMARRDRQICPFPLRNVNLGHIDPSEQNKPFHMHVDGDMLSRVVEFGIGHFRSMLIQAPIQNEYQKDFETSEARMARFCELAGHVVGGGNDEDKAVLVMEWMRNHLQLVL